jgi:pyruvate,water dikinase
MLDKSDFQGTPASPGIVTGKARVIRSVEDANKLEQGEIMVVSLTDVGWTPYYCLASGLITEIGSCLSHGVVVAREYGLPTIVSVKDIMRSIKDGDIITMDGTKGTVTLVEKAEE